MRPLTLVLALFGSLSLGLASSCGGKKKAAPEETTTACATNEDCEAGLVCLAGECADPRIYSGSSNMVTPDKVKREVEMRTEEAQKRADEAADL